MNTFNRSWTITLLTLTAMAVSLDFQRKAQRILTTLSPREEKILRMRFGIGEKAEHRLEETGKYSASPEKEFARLRSRR
jgi:RNA polymerase primary sigma factor